MPYLPRKALSIHVNLKIYPNRELPTINEQDEKVQKQIKENNESQVILPEG